MLQAASFAQPAWKVQGVVASIAYLIDANFRSIFNYIILNPKTSDNFAMFEGWAASVIQYEPAGRQGSLDDWNRVWGVVSCKFWGIVSYKSYREFDGTSSNY